MNVAIVDYGMGNLFSVARAVESCGATASVVDTPEKVCTAEMLLLPGVGAFREGMQELRERDLVRPLREYAESGRPLLAICLGMQMLFERSEENGDHEGLGVVKGKVKEVARKKTSGADRKIPHIGWGTLREPVPGRWSGSILEGISSGSAGYFVHSYHAEPISSEVRLADCDYDGVTICAAVQQGKITGCQFHPEKSGRVGLEVVARFLQLELRQSS